MRFGVCTGWKNAAALQRYGYDYIELGFNALNRMSTEEFSECRATLGCLGMAAETYNCFFFGGQIIIGEQVDFTQIRDYVRPTFDRAAQLGGKIAVIGSGTARQIPEGMSKDVYDAQLDAMLNLVADEAAAVGMRICVEPLNAAETNSINTVEEALAVVKRVNRPEVGCLADFYHVSRSGESLDAVRQAGGLLLHTHLARPGDRGMPREEDIPVMREWSGALRECGYDARLSLEGIIENFDTEVSAAREALRVFE